MENNVPFQFHFLPRNGIRMEWKSNRERTREKNISTVMSIEIRQKKGQNRGVEWSKLTLRKCAVEGLNCHEVDKFEF